MNMLELGLLIGGLGAFWCMCRMTIKHYSGLRGAKDWIPVFITALGLTLITIAFIRDIGGS